MEVQPGKLGQTQFLGLGWNVTQGIKQEPKVKIEPE